MAKKNSKKSEIKVVNELISQLILRAEAWGRKDYYTPLKLEEMQLEASQKLIGELLSEKANLEYELHAIGTNKRDALIKIERLNTYVLRAKYSMQKHIDKIKAMLGKKIGDKDKLTVAVAHIGKQPNVSVMVGSN
ncbi:MAG: hypothetical protein WC901_03055 [Candidatus Margulisiibacteriota bacterium]